MNPLLTLRNRIAAIDPRDEIGVIEEIRQCLLSLSEEMRGLSGQVNANVNTVPPPTLSEAYQAMKSRAEMAEGEILRWEKFNKDLRATLGCTDGDDSLLVAKHMKARVHVEDLAEVHQAMTRAISASEIIRHKSDCRCPMCVLLITRNRLESKYPKLQKTQP